MTTEQLSPIRDRLFQLGEEKYQAFQAKLIPNIPPKTIIGVRTPDLRRLGRELAGTEEEARFLADLPHKYFEENSLHGLLLSQIKDYRACVEGLDAFLPYVDNWAVCDIISPKIFKKHLPELEGKIREWMSSAHPYTIRFGLEMLMSFYLDEAFREEYLDWAAAVRSEEYYVNMMIAWFFATALAKQYQASLAYIEEQRLDGWTHNKAIQKAIESYRITDEQKAYLRTLKIKQSRKGG